MTITSFGDQGRAFAISKQVAQLRQRIDRLAAEMTTGKRLDVASSGGRDVAHLLALRHDRQIAESYHYATLEAGNALGAAQAALDRIGAEASERAPTLVAAALSGNLDQISIAATSAREALASVVSALNQTNAGMSLFGGSQSDQPALAAADTIISEVQAAAGGATSASGLAAAVDAWFAPGGGFDSHGYGGNADPLTFPIGNDRKATLPVTAADPEIRDLLRNLVLATLAPEVSDPVGQADALRNAGEGLLAFGGDLAVLRGRLGQAEEAVEKQEVALGAHAHALDLAEASFTAADVFGAAAALEESMTRLESLHMITARVSSLSLAGYLR